MSGEAGIIAHLGTNDMLEVENWVLHGDKHAELILNAMIWNVAKCIAAEGAVLKGKVDAILLTGGLARSQYITDHIKERVEFIAPCHHLPGPGRDEGTHRECPCRAPRRASGHGLRRGCQQRKRPLSKEKYYQGVGQPDGCSTPLFLFWGKGQGPRVRAPLLTVSPLL